MTFKAVIDNVIFEGNGEARLARNDSQKKVKPETSIGEFGDVVTTTYLHSTSEYLGKYYNIKYLGFYNVPQIYEIHQEIERFEPLKARGNLVFQACYLRTKDGRKGLLHFFPRLLGSADYEYQEIYWNFKLEFDYDSPKGFAYACKMHMIPGVSTTRTVEIDIHTCELLMTKFFDSCNPDCEYDFKDMFIEIFKYSKYKELREYAEISARNYEDYKLECTEKNEPLMLVLLRKMKKR